MSQNEVRFCAEEAGITNQTTDGELEEILEAQQSDLKGAIIIGDCNVLHEIADWREELVAKREERQMDYPSR